MSELSGTAAVGIETVEWLDGGSGNLIVRVTGRWRRRRPASTAQVTLVIESEGRRHRFPAMPEPPSVGGTGPGMWRLSFSVPGSLAPALGGNIWLALGTVTVPLPAPGAGERVSAPARIGEPAPVETSRPPDETPSADRVSELESQLADIRSDRDQLAASLAEGERTRRIAEQRAHAEQALRSDLTRQLASHERQTERVREAMGELAAAEDRIRMLERQLRDARRREAEAEQQAAAAVARARARPAAEPASSSAVEPMPPLGSAPPPARELEAARLRFEHRLRARVARTGARVPAEPDRPPASLDVSVTPAPEQAAVEPEQAPASSEPPPIPTSAAVPASALVDTLRRELDARASGEAALRSRLVAAETRLAARVLLDQRTTEALSQLRTELDGLRAVLAQERSRRQAAESRAAELEGERRARAHAERRAGRLEQELGGQRERSRDAYDAIEELRGALERLATAPVPRERPALDAVAVAPETGSSSETSPSPDTGASKAAGPSAETSASTESGPVQADRLSDALTRLRESVALPEAAAVSVTAGGRTLETAFRRLVKRDAAVAGELLLDLLVLQRAAYPHPVAYDLVLGPGRGCVRVTVGEGPPVIERQGAARTREEVDFRVRGEPARIARLLTAHGIWRRLGPRVARVRGRRDGLVALQALLAMPLDLVALRDGGATLRPEAIFGLVGGMVDPAWTAGESFVIAHRDPDGAVTYLTVRDGRAPAVTQTAPAGRIATTIDGPAEALVMILSGAPAPEGRLSGDEGPLESLRTWIKRASA
jgi:hypothetical protein